MQADLHIGGIGESIRSLRGEEALEEVVHRIDNLPRQIFRRVRERRRHSIDPRHRALRIQALLDERVVTDDHLVDHHAKSEEVCAAVDLLAAELLWRHVRRRTSRAMKSCSD
jgi:hypothetical protein